MRQVLCTRRNRGKSVHNFFAETRLAFRPDARGSNYWCAMAPEAGAGVAADFGFFPAVNERTNTVINASSDNAIPTARNTGKLSLSFDCAIGLGKGTSLAPENRLKPALAGWGAPPLFSVPSDIARWKC